jgi:hypothetical protein
MYSDALASQLDTRYSQIMIRSNAKHSVQRSLAKSEEEGMGSQPGGQQLTPCQSLWPTRTVVLLHWPESYRPGSESYLGTH